MKSVTSIIYLLLAVSLFGFEPIQVGDITVINKTYKNAVVVAKESDGIKIMHDGGPARIKHELLPLVLPDAVVKKIGEFDLNEAQNERLRKKEQMFQLDSLSIPKPIEPTRTIEEIVSYNESLDLHASYLKKREIFILEKLSEVPTVSKERNTLLKQLDQTRMSIITTLNKKLSLPITKEEIKRHKK